MNWFVSAGRLLRHAKTALRAKNRTPHRARRQRSSIIPISWARPISALSAPIRRERPPANKAAAGNKVVSTAANRVVSRAASMAANRVNRTGKLST